MGEKLTGDELREYAAMGAREQLRALRAQAVEIEAARDRLLTHFPELEDEEEDDAEELPRVLYSDTPKRNGKSNGSNSNGHAKKKGGIKKGTKLPPGRVTNRNAPAETLSFVNSRTETTIADLAKRFDLQTGAASMRLLKLMKQKKIVRLSPGVFAPLRES